MDKERKEERKKKYRDVNGEEKEGRRYRRGDGREEGSM